MMTEEARQPEPKKKMKPEKKRRRKTFVGHAFSKYRGKNRTVFYVVQVGVSEKLK